LIGFVSRSTGKPSGVRKVSRASSFKGFRALSAQRNEDVNAGEVERDETSI
jgi:hypothetical protein